VYVFFLFTQQLHCFAGFRRNTWAIAKNFQALLNKERIIELEKVLNNQGYNHTHHDSCEHINENPEICQLDDVAVHKETCTNDQNDRRNPQHANLVAVNEIILVL